MSKFYTGIGSRQTPKDILELMREIAKQMSKMGYILRSGAAEGADTAFEEGHEGDMVIYLPWPGFNSRDSVKHPEIYKVPIKNFKETDPYPSVKALDLAMSVHPKLKDLSNGVKRLHARNMFQVLGDDLETPSELVIYWAPEDKGYVEGGTATAVKMARKNGIDAYNLGIEMQREELLERLENME